jgi:hypothetical protein
MTDPLHPPVAAPTAVDPVTDAVVGAVDAATSAVDAATGAAVDAVAAPATDAELLRRFEPVLPLTSGEPPGGC